MNENTAQVLQAAIAFCDALLQIEGEVPGNVYNLITFSGNGFAVDHALKGQTTLLENHRAALREALNASQE